MRAETVLAAVESVEAGMGLKNEISLAGKPEACVFEVRKHRFGAVVGGGVDGVGRRDRLGLPSYVKLLRESRDRRAHRDCSPQGEDSPSYVEIRELRAILHEFSLHLTSQ